MEQVFRFGAFEVTLCRKNGEWKGITKMDKPPYKADFPSILTEGVPFVVTREGVRGEYTKYLFPSLIPVIVKKCQF